MPDVKVRKSVCESLRTLTSLSAEFAREALDSLMDVLNDDSVVVRLQALETMHHMAIDGRLKLHDKHLHMVCFLSFLNHFSLFPAYILVPTVFLFFETARSISCWPNYGTSFILLYGDLLIICILFFF